MLVIRYSTDQPKMNKRGMGHVVFILPIYFINVQCSQSKLYNSKPMDRFKPHISSPSPVCQLRSAATHRPLHIDSSRVFAALSARVLRTPVFLGSLTSQFHSLYNCLLARLKVNIREAEMILSVCLDKIFFTGSRNFLQSRIFSAHIP